MEKKNIVKEYPKEDLVVVWKPDLCIHSKNCIHGLPGVFDFERRPWIDVSQAGEESIADQIKKCPSGALSYYLKSEGKPKEEQSLQGPTQIEIIMNGPIMVAGNLQIKNADGSIEEKNKKTFLCRCGASGNKPYCDGSHKSIGFQG